MVPLPPIVRLVHLPRSRPRLPPRHELRPRIDRPTPHDLPITAAVRVPLSPATPPREVNVFLPVPPDKVHRSYLTYPLESESSVADLLLYLDSIDGETTGPCALRNRTRPRDILTLRVDRKVSISTSLPRPSHQMLTCQVSSSYSSVRPDRRSPTCRP